MACTIWMSIVASPCTWLGMPPTTCGVNFGRSNQSEKLSRSRWSKPSKANTTTVLPLPVKPPSSSGLRLYAVISSEGSSPPSGTSRGIIGGTPMW